MTAAIAVARAELELAAALLDLDRHGRPWLLARSWCAPESGYVCWLGLVGERGRVPHGTPFHGQTLTDVVRAASAAAAAPPLAPPRPLDTSPPGSGRPE